MSFLNKGLKQEEEMVITERASSSQYLVINSADRNQNSSLDGFDSGASWSDFKVQKPQAILDGFARRIRPVEIRFPWFVPNISVKNNKLWLLIDPGIPPSTLKTIVLPPGFYTPSSLVSALNLALATAVPTSPPIFSYNQVSYTYTLTVGSASVVLYSIDPANNNNLLADWYNRASLLKTLGFYNTQAGALVTPTATMTGGSTLSSYTDYVDIVSDKLMYYTDVKDGSSSNQNTNTSLIMRVFATNEVSLADANGVPQTCTPFLISRQFKNAKNIQWNPDAMVDWLDIKVLDMYGDVIDLPQYRAPGISGFQNGSYPDFQITFLASEN